MATETKITYTMSAAGMAALQAFIDQANAQRSPDEQLTTTPEEYFTDFCATQEQAWISAARSQIQSETVSTFNSLPVDNQKAVLGQMGITVDEALLVSTAPDATTAVDPTPATPDPAVAPSAG